MNEDLLQYANGNKPRSEQEKELIIEKASAAYECYMDALGSVSYTHLTLPTKRIV